MSDIHDESAGNSKAENGLVFIVFFVSGAAALIYEISWSRQIGLLFGHTIHAASVVLSSYFAGMGLGYLVGARISSRVPSLVAYALAELTVAVWALIIPFLLMWSESPSIAPWLSHPSFGVQTAVRVVFSFLLLLPATVALGITLPAMANYLAGAGRRIRTENETGDLTIANNASRVSLAYAVNTLGAVVGVLAATFFMLVTLGVVRSSYIAAGLSALCGIAAFLMWRIQARASSDDRGVNESPTRELGSHQFPLLALAFLSGLGTLALQVLYTRMFSLVLHNSTYTFGLVVAVFLGALALGSAMAAKLVKRFEARWLAGNAMVVGSLLICLSAIIFAGQTRLDYFFYGDSFWSYIFGVSMLVGAVVAPPITLLAMVLPLVWKMAGEFGTAGQVVGRMTAANTIAAALGAMLTSFLLLPTLGLWVSAALVALLFFLAGFSSLWKDNRRKWPCVAALLFGVLAMFSVSYPTRMENSKLGSEEKIIQRWNSAYGWIDALQREGSGTMTIRQNLHYRFGETGANAREYRQADMPILLHPNPTDVLFLGIGTGLTAGGAIPHPQVEKIVAVELIPEVVEAARLLGEHNFNVVDHPKVEIVVDDGRHHLLADARQFDVIVSDLFVPWESQSGYLYTVEHYRVARKRLKPGGIFCQWLPLYQVGTREFELIADSFASVFPNTTIWWGQIESPLPVVALIGAEQAFEIDGPSLAKRLKLLDKPDKPLDPTIANVHQFWRRYLGDWNSDGDAILNTDEHPRVEFLTPISNREGELVQRDILEQYFEDVFANLPCRNATINDPSAPNQQERLERHRLFLFGRTEKKVPQ